MARDIVVAGIMAVAAALIGAFLVLVFTPFINFGAAEADLAVAAPRAEPGEAFAISTVRYFPPRPQDAPESIRELVLLGEQIVKDTKKLVPDHVGGDLTCAHCHFDAGISDGGANNGISLVGAAVKYPRVEGELGVIDLRGKINACFRVNLLGRPLDPQSREMAALATYIQWISRGVPIYADVAWLGVEPLETKAAPDVAAGKKIHDEQCSMCHGKDGEGTRFAPSAWGERSWSAASQMNRPEILAAFIHANMPRYNPLADPRQAADTAAYILSKPRPPAPDGKSDASVK